MSVWLFRVNKLYNIFIYLKDLVDETDPVTEGVGRYFMLHAGTIIRLDIYNR